MSNQTHYVIELNSKINIKILNHLYRSCIIVGIKTILENHKVAIVELDDYTRIWMLPEEINATKININEN